VYFFDVGQGDAVLIQSPNGQNLIYDGGRSAGGLLDHLNRLAVSRVDAVIASHNHADHISGLALFSNSSVRPSTWTTASLPLPSHTSVFLRLSEQQEANCWNRLPGAFR
jgi:beta-lactamase superfamily II metal-dependent hydrolase